MQMSHSHSQPANVFFLMRLTRNNGKVISNPRAAQRKLRRKLRSEKHEVKRVQFYGGGGGADGVCVCHG
jgi:hypothetical protein